MGKTLLISGIVFCNWLCMIYVMFFEPLEVAHSILAFLLYCWSTKSSFFKQYSAKGLKYYIQDLNDSIVLCPVVERLFGCVVYVSDNFSKLNDYVKNDCVFSVAFMCAV